MKKKDKLKGTAKMNVTERFLKYVSFDTRSDPKSGTHPSSARQLVLAKELADELAAMGLEDVLLDEKGYVYGVVPASDGAESEPLIGLVAHMDTSPDCSGENVRPQLIDYEGGDIVLNAEKGIIMRTADFPHMENYIGGQLIVTDGTTLLGADDKAGVAEIFTVVERLMSDRSLRHGRIPVCITPDEEIGEGADAFDISRFGADFAYTVDGGALGEIEYENFNAASAVVTVNGVNIHPGDAKGKMKNSLLIGVEFATLLPADEIPAMTEKYEGFFHLCEMTGKEEKTVLSYIIRDHNRQIFEHRKQQMSAAADAMNEKYGAGTVELDMRDSYYNMKEKIEPHMHIIERARAAMTAAGVEPLIVPIRGGTDGARLSYEGLPCPNLSTGGHNFHGRYEYIPVRSMEKMVDVLLHIVCL